MSYRDRIKELRRVKARDLIPHKRNWRIHPKEQQTVLSGFLEKIGIADAVLAREDGEGNLVLIDGHLRRSLTGDQLIPALILDVTEAEADELLLAHDPIGSMAQADDSILADLVSSIDMVDDALLSELERVARPIETTGEDYSALDLENDRLVGAEERSIHIVVPTKHVAKVKRWLAGEGEDITGPGMGRGVLRKCGLLS